ncbi:MAG: hypothetical protein WAW73_10830 [Rhodoferax sp.]
MSALQCIDVFNIVMGLGIVVLSLAIRDIDRSNEVLRNRNLRERKRDKELLPELDYLNEGQLVPENGHRELGHEAAHSV